MRVSLITCVAAVISLGIAVVAFAQATAKKSPRFVKSRDGTSIAYDQTGAGPVVILVAGALSARSANGRLAPLLESSFTVISYDRRGRGDSGDTRPYAVQREVEDIEALIDASGGSAFVFGSSSGAALALEAAAGLPEKVKRAVLFEPPFITDASRSPVPSDFQAKLAELLSADRRGDAVELFMTTAVGVPTEAVAQMRQSPMWPSMEKLAPTLAYDMAVMGDTLFGRPLPAERWRSAVQPILVLDGDQSDAWLRHSAESLAKLLPHAKYQSLPGQNHSASFTAPQVLAPVLVEFFLH